MERSIDLRQQGYRHRAFMLVDSNEGMEYMDQSSRASVFAIRGRGQQLREIRQREKC